LASLTLLLVLLWWGSTLLGLLGVRAGLLLGVSIGVLLLSLLLWGGTLLGLLRVRAGLLL